MQRLRLTKIVEYIQNICNQPLDKLAHSVLTVITKARQGDDFFDLPQIKFVVQQKIIQEFMGQSFMKRQFFKIMTETVVVYDPLNRALPSSKKNYAITNEALKQLIQNDMVPQKNNKNLTFPLDNRINEWLNEEMEQKFQECKKISSDFKLMKKEQPFEFASSFRDNQVVNDIYRIVNFFESSKLNLLDE